MRQVIGRALWLGNPGDTRDAQLVLNAGIEAIVELADNEPLASLPRELIRCRFPLSDGGENPAWILKMAAESVAALLRAQTPTLVCCSGGMNRSVCIAADRPLTKALLMIVDSGPADVSPRLLAQLQLAIGK